MCKYMYECVHVYVLKVLWSYVFVFLQVLCGAGWVDGVDQGKCYWICVLVCRSMCLYVGVCVCVWIVKQVTRNNIYQKTELPWNDVYFICWMKTGPVWKEECYVFSFSPRGVMVFNCVIHFLSACFRCPLDHPDPDSTPDMMRWVTGCSWKCVTSVVCRCAREMLYRCCLSLVSIEEPVSPM